MPNALETNPPAPNPGAMSTAGALPMGPNALAPGQPQGQPGQPPGQPAPPPPSHAQTVASLRHFSAIEQELTILLRDPDLGKADLKSKIIDGTANLVSRRILSPPEAVMQLGSVPDRPFDQKQWLENHLIQAVKGAASVLDMHGQAFAGQPQAGGSPPNPDDHMATMNGFMAQLKGAPANG